MSVCICTWCGQTFEGKRTDSLFCNQACKQKYWRWKHHLQALRVRLLATIDEVSSYLQNQNTENEASIVLGEIADDLCGLGFVATEKQMEFPVDAYRISNKLGGKNA